MLRRAVGRRLLRAAAGRSGRSRGLSLQPLAHLGSPGVHTLHDSLGLDSSAAALAGLLATGLPPPAPPPVAPAAASLAELTPAAATAGDVSLFQPHSLEPGAKLPEPPEPPEPPPEPLAQLRDTSDPAAAASAADLASPMGETPAPPAPQPVFTPQPVGPPPEGPQAAVFGPSLPVGEEVSPLHIVPLPVLTPGLDAAGKEAAAAAALLTSRDGGFFFHYPMMGIEYLILGVHDVTGLPWWGSIVAATVAGRLILFPLQVSASRAMGRGRGVAALVAGPVCLAGGLLCGRLNSPQRNFSTLSHSCCRRRRGIASSFGPHPLPHDRCISRAAQRT